MTVSNGKHKENNMPDDALISLNPFIHRLELDNPFDKIKTAVLTVLLLPFRVICICLLLITAWILACIGLYGMSFNELRTKPLTGWRRTLRNITAFTLRVMFFAGSFHYIKVKGTRASKKMAPIVVANHSSFFDAFCAIYLQAPAVVAKAETRSLPILGTGGMAIKVKGRQSSRTEAPILVIAPHSTFLDSVIVYVTNMSTVIVRKESMDNYAGKLINYTQPIYVWRDDPNSRQNTIKNIIDRANSEEDWPQILIFPEGTCTNRSCLITFKPGAFYPAVPIQPVCIRYPNKLDTVTWTWEGPGALKLLWLTLTQVHSSCEIEFLPVYYPSEEEKINPKLYAHNVRNVMAKALEIPVSEYTYGHCKLMNRCKQMNNPYASAIVDVEKLRCKIGLNLTNIEEQVVTLVNDNNCNITLIEFALRLQVSATDPATSALFSLFDKSNSGVIDFREYLLCALFLIKSHDSTINLLVYVFKMYESCGKVTQNSLYLALKNTIASTREESDEIFTQIDKETRGYITFDEFLSYAEQKSEFSKYFTNGVNQSDKPKEQ